MKLKILTLLVGGLILTACGPKPEPTPSPEDIQGTAVSAAFTMIAETQAALPTATPIPPTETPSPIPSPTNTVVFLEVPTQSIAAVAPTATAPADYCSSLTYMIPGDAAGPKTKIKIQNEHKSVATVSLYLNKTPFGECGYRGYTLVKNGSTTDSSLPQGCYNIWAWSDDPKDRFNVSGYGCANNPDRWTFVIRGERIVFLSP